MVGGTVVEAIAGLFMTLSARAQKQMGVFYEKMRDDRRLEEALKLAREMKPDDTLGTRVQVLLALKLVSLDEIPELFQHTIRPPAEPAATPPPKDEAR